MKYSFLLAMFFVALSTSAQTTSYEYVPLASKASSVALPDFTVKIKGSYEPQPSVFAKPSKIFALSDIEGEYEALKKLLIAAGVMDQRFQWTFGTGNLVVCGDMFDRGNRVAEVLWLIYYLEEKAKAAGGYVHYILGNHELMNLTGDLRYLNPRYLDVAKQNGVSYASFYSDSTELGRWIRSKNIMEKIGDLLFIHGGISQLVNEANLTVDSVNIIARPFYDKPEGTLTPVSRLLLLDDGPLWYRGYFYAPAITEAAIDSTLHLFGVKKIVVGHTLQPHVSAFYDGKIIDMDVHHAKGISEGLLVDGNKYYRVAADGTKTLLLSK